MSWRVFLSVAILLALAPAGLAQEKTEKSDKSSKKEAESETIKVADGKYTLQKPSSWKKVEAKSTMIEHEFRAPAEGEKKARITIMSAGGSIKDNIDRWIGQFEGAKKEDAKVEQKEVGDTKVHTVELEGVFKESMGGPFAPNAKTVKQEGYRLLGAILEGKDGSKVFIKATGPKEIIGDMRDEFVKMLEELKSN